MTLIMCKVSFAETLCIRLVNFFNESQKQNALNQVRSGSISAYYVTISLLRACTTISNYRWNLNITDGNNSVCVQYFNNLQDLIHYVYHNSIKLNIDLHKFALL